MKKIRAVLAGVFVTITMGAGLALVGGPAMAEGNWSSFIDNGYVGFSSRSWEDNQLDNVATRAVFSGCTTDFAPPPGNVDDIDLNLYRELGILPDQSAGVRLNTCGTSSWARSLLAADYYHWTVEQIEGLSGGSINLNVSSLTTYY